MEGQTARRDHDAIDFGNLAVSKPTANEWLAGIVRSAPATGAAILEGARDCANMGQRMQILAIKGVREGVAAGFRKGLYALPSINTPFDYG